VFHSIGRGRDESIRLGGSYKTDGLEVGRDSQQIPEHNTTLALVFQGVSIQAPAAKPDLLQSQTCSKARNVARNEYLAGSRPE
jgi:hypothetical protein